jgi:hypothetical protein
MRTTSLIIEAVLLFGVIVTASGQAAPNVNQTATRTSCSNIVALSGAKVDCTHLTQAQSNALANIPAILKMAIESQNYLDAILKQLQEMSVPQSVTNNIAPGGFATSGGILINPTVISLGESPPHIEGLQVTGVDGKGNELPREAQGHALTNVKFYTDTAWDDPKFRVDCDRPCIAYDAKLFEPSTTIYPTMESASSSTYPDSTIFILLSLRPFIPDMYYVFTVASMNSEPVKVLSVSPFVGRVKPQQ